MKYFEQKWWGAKLRLANKLKMIQSRRETLGRMYINRRYYEMSLDDYIREDGYLNSLYIQADHIVIYLRNLQRIKFEV